MIDARTAKNRMEFVRNRAKEADGRKPGWRRIHEAAVNLNVISGAVEWFGDRNFPEKWQRAEVDGLVIQVCPLWVGGFRWEIRGERRLVGDCDTMEEAKDAVERVIGLFREAQCG